MFWTDQLTGKFPNGIPPLDIWVCFPPVRLDFERLELSGSTHHLPLLLSDRLYQREGPMLVAF